MEFLTESIALADVQRTSLGLFTFSDDFQREAFSFEARLSTPFAAAANTKYWFSPLSTSAAFLPVLFIWGPGGDPAPAETLFSKLLDTGDTGVQNGDRAFSLAAIPEPSSVLIWSLLGLTLGVGSWRRRKR